ncbi:hypothetical protein JCM6882_000723 [Rhodosporidiobolus microsporus]
MPDSPTLTDSSSPKDHRSPAVPERERNKSPVISPPLNYLRFAWEFSLAILGIPYYLVKYAVFPSTRPRRRWTLLEASFLPTIKRIMVAFDLCGFKISTRDPYAEPMRWPLKLRDVTFEWVEKIPDDLVGGIIDDKWIAQREKVGMYSWRRKDAKKEGKGQGVGGEGEGGKLVGLFFHGGAYNHNSAHPGSPSSDIARTLFDNEPRFSSMHTVEYRLLPKYPFPAALQDVAAVYVSLLRRGVEGHQIVLIGDSSGGHLALALARWVKDIIKSGKGDLRDEGKVGKDGEQRKWKMEEPAGLMLFSPWTDPSHSYLNSTPETYVPRRNSCDYLFEEGPFRHHIVDGLLGSHEKKLVLSPYVSPGAPSQPSSIFADFPACFVHYGTGERCMEEGVRLVEKLKDAGVKTSVTVTEDTPHDPILLKMIWNKRQIQQIWDGAIEFVQTLNVKKAQTRVD